MVHADRRDHARKRRLDHIGGIEPAAESDFEQQHVGRMFCEQQEAGRGLRLEEGEWLARIDLFAMLQRRLQFVVTDQHAAQAETFVDAHQPGRGVGVNAKARGFEDRAQIGDRRTLAVGAGDMDHRRQIFDRGWPSRSSTRCMRSRLRSMRFGCSAESRAITPSSKARGLAAGAFTRAARPAPFPGPTRSVPARARAARPLARSRSRATW